MDYLVDMMPQSPAVQTPPRQARMLSSIFSLGLQMLYKPCELHHANFTSEEYSLNEDVSCEVPALYDFIYLLIMTVMFCLMALYGRGCEGL